MSQSKTDGRKTKRKNGAYSARLTLPLIVTAIMVGGCNGPDPSGTWRDVSGNALLLITRQTSDKYSAKYTDTSQVLVFSRAGRTLSASELGIPIVIEFSNDWRNATYHAGEDDRTYVRLAGEGEKEALSSIGRQNAATVVGLDDGEQLFVNGVKADLTNLAFEPDKPVNIATAKNGLMRRIGVSNGERHLDVRSLLTFSPDLAEKDPVTLNIKASRPECYAVFNGKRSDQALQATGLQVAPYKVASVAIICPGRETWSSSVLGVAGQMITLDVAQRLQQDGPTKK
jgi:hypothetical protein